MDFIGYFCFSPGFYFVAILFTIVGIYVASIIFRDSDSSIGRFIFGIIGFFIGMIIYAIGALIYFEIYG